MFVKFKIMCLLMLISTISSADYYESNSLNLMFGIYASESPSLLSRKFKPVLNELEERMGRLLGKKVNITLSITKTYEESIVLLANGTFDFARFGPVSYIEAKKINPDIKLLALENDNGNKEFYGIIAISSKSNINVVDDLRNKSFAFGDEGSTIGRFLAQQYLVEHGITANNLSNFEYLQRHDNAGRAVATYSFDAGALKESTFDALVADGWDIQEFDRFPNVTKPWIASSKLPLPLVDLIKEALLSIDNTHVLAKLKIEGFLEGSDSDYDTIRDSIDYNYKFFKSDD